MEVVNAVVRRWLQDAANDYEDFWARAAGQMPWFRRWDQVFERDGASFKWFVGAQTNLAYNCLDHWVGQGRGGHAALIYENERGERQVFTYAQLLAGVRRIAAALRGLGVRRGDRVAIYMPVGAEAIQAMLACARIGAIHIVIFAGFGGPALAERMRLAGCKLLLAADVVYRKGNNVPLGPMVEAALAAPGLAVEKVVWQVRGAEPPPLVAGRDLTWDEFLAGGAGQSGDHAVMEANDPAYILATSGTTATPKLAVHSHGAYQVGIRSTADWCFGLEKDDIWWSTSDIGWVVGHSFIVYAPLLVGCTTIAYEGALDYPNAETFYRIIAENQVTGVFTAPTAIRMLMRVGAEPARGHDLSSLQRVFSAGEVLNAPAWEWFQKEVLQDRVPVFDHMWQTETGGPVIGNPYGIAQLPIKPGSGGVALPGFSVEIRNLEGEVLNPGERGIVVFTKPFPGLTATIWGDPKRYARDYWGKLPGVYFTGDAALMDEDGYLWFSGRADEVIKIAAHRIGTIEVETAFLRHPAVAEAGVTGRPDEVRGEVISAFVVLRAGHEPSEALQAELLHTVRHELGPVAVVGEINFVHMLPKTRSGKIMRRVLKAVTLGRDPGDISTIEDEGSVEDARHAWLELHQALGHTL